MTRERPWHFVQATKALEPDGLESEQTNWYCLADRPMDTGTARNIALLAVQKQGYARSRIFRGKRVGRLIATYTAKENPYEQ